ncbi:MAG TPA: hypothetical protein VG477_15055 [Thermoanaerobaculia bacterium]|nr:hypothetical protein [Thermoanaerobaculia bacterium]
MKKRTKQLNLVRETLSHLQDGDLKGARGGGGGDTSEACRVATFCECDTQACGGTGSFCNTMTNCSNC